MKNGVREEQRETDGADSFLLSDSAVFYCIIISSLRHGFFQTDSLFQIKMFFIR